MLPQKGGCGRCRKHYLRTEPWVAHRFDPGIQYSVQQNAFVSFSAFCRSPRSQLLIQSSQAPRAYFPSFATWSWLSTLNTPETPLARISAMAISASLFTTPVSVTWPFLTMIWIA